MFPVAPRASPDVYSSHEVPRGSLELLEIPLFPACRARPCKFITLVAVQPMARERTVMIKKLRKLRWIFQMLRGLALTWARFL